MTDWIVRKFKDSDFEDFLEWRKVIARREKTQEYIDWEYKRGPWGPAETWVADDNGKIVGQYSTQRYEAFYFGKKMLVSSSFDTGAHPKYFHPKKNIFQAVGKKFFEEEAKQNIHYSTGWPNEYFLFGGLRLGWKIVSPVPLMDNNKISELNIDKSTNYEIVEIQKFDSEFNGFSEKFKDEIPIFLNRTQKYLNWRFVEKPNLKDQKFHYNYSKFKIYNKAGEMVSYIVTKIFPSEQERILHLIDFLQPHEEEIYQSILNFLRNYAKEENINTISLFINKFNPFSEYL
ncbi:MAG: GNAT family N-acetyltransferase, partial [Candidatus Hermodarchaeota archaeon]